MTHPIPEDLKKYYAQAKRVVGFDTSFGAIAEKIVPLIERVGSVEIERDTLQKRVEALKYAMIQIRGGINLMVPEPQKSGFLEIINAALIAARSVKP